jgi:hypothetical protein
MRAPHYNMVLIPLFVPAMVFCIEKLLVSFSLSKHRAFKFGAPVFLLCVFFNYQILSAIRFCYGNIKSGAKNYFESLGNFIDENSTQDDTVSVVGNQCVIYLFTERESASKYIYQLPPATVSEKIKNEYIADMRNMKPYLIMPLDTGKNESARDIFASVFELIRNDYHECYNSGQHVIYKRK